MSEARERLAAAQEGRRQRGLHPKGTDQTYEEQTRVLMTWTKAELVRSLIREESDKLKAIDQLIDARAAQAVSLPDRDVRGNIIKDIADELWKFRTNEGGICDADRDDVDYTEAYGVAEVLADAVLAALSTQPAAGEAE